jgi:hypothetical protein
LKFLVVINFASQKVNQRREKHSLFHETMMTLARVDANKGTYVAQVGLQTTQITMNNNVKNRKYTKTSYIQCGRFLSKEERETVTISKTRKFAGNVLNKVQPPV